MQHNCKCNVNTEAAYDLMLNKAGCSVTTEMQFISHNGCCSKFKRTEKQGMGEGVCSPNSYWQGGVPQLPALLVLFPARTFWQVFVSGKSGSVAIRICSLNSCQYLRSYCYWTSVSKVTLSFCMAQSQGCLAGISVPQPESPRNLCYFVFGRTQQTNSKV